MLRQAKMGVLITAAMATGWAAVSADAAAFRTWVGINGGTALFSDQANWDGGTDIANGDFLAFGAGVPLQAGDITNDLTNFSVTRVTFAGNGFYHFNLKGNPLTVTESIIAQEDSGEQRIQLDIKGASNTSLIASGASLHLSGNNTFPGPIDVYGQLFAESNTALGSTAGATTVEPGGSLRVDGRDLAEPIKIAGPEDAVGTCGVESHTGTTVLRDVEVVAGQACIAGPGATEVNLPNGIRFAPTGSDLFLGLGAFRVGGTSTGTGTVRPVLSDVIWNSTSNLNILIAPYLDADNLSNFSGSGSAHDFAFTGGGVFAPGTDSGPGRFTASGLFAIQHATAAFAITGTTAGTGYSAVQAGGLVSIGIETMLELDLGIGFIPTVGSQFRIIDNTGAQAVIGTFDGLPEGATFTRSGRPWSITYKGGTGNDVVVTALQPDLHPFKRFLTLIAADR